jgi:hypothetical protein
MTPKTEAGAEQAQTEQAQTQAAEIKEEIEETATEATAARDAGDTTRAAKLDADVAALRTDLSAVMATLKTLAERPFHPAPEARETATEATTETAPEAETETEATRPPARTSRWFGSRWNED